MSATEKHHSQPVALLALAALGVVFGDIGTSPLYALREVFHGHHAITLNHDSILGVLSLVFYSLLIIITGMYVTLMLRADNRGEGGILALMVLTLNTYGETRTRHKIVLTMIGLFGAALLIGDGMITPSISVLSAVEGLEQITPAFTPYILPIVLLILFGIFSMQRHGTGRLGFVFGPIIMLWFITLAALGIAAIVKNPEVLKAINPMYAVQFFQDYKFVAFVALGSVFLVVTGGEALYADMGHFGAKPIRLAWYGLVMPALLLNYFGQGALLLQHPEITNPFFGLAPEWLLGPLVILATLATIIASQAMISGVFSLVRQAVLLGFLPRMHVVHTSSQAMGQIYVPAANTLLMFGTMGLVIGFQSSSNLAGAYGVAVTTTMLFTTLLLYTVAVNLWRWPVWGAVPVVLVFLTFNAAFTGAAWLKIPEGGWFPLLVGIVGFVIMTTWRRGRKLLWERLGSMTKLPLEIFVPNVSEGEHAVHRVAGAAVYLYSADQGTPRAMLHNLRYNKVLHEMVVVLTIKILDRPRVPESERVVVNDLGHGFFRVFANYGFMEEPNVIEVLKLGESQGLKIEVPTTAFILARENMKFTAKGGMSRWRRQLFVFMARNASEPSGFFNIPVNQVVELGIQVEV